MTEIFMARIKTGSEILDKSRRLVTPTLKNKIEIRKVETENRTQNLGRKKPPKPQNLKI